MSGAKAVFVPTLYIEPFGGVNVEAMFCGTPAITTDFGGFTETVQHGKTGYRCHTMDDFVWAAKNVDRLDPYYIRDYAVNNYSMDRVSLMYDEYFSKLMDLYRNGWYELHPERTELDWLRRY
jgi:glycosyltransferase involved in cell wall biosynthesis